MVHQIWSDPERSENHGNPRLEEDEVVGQRGFTAEDARRIDQSLAQVAHIDRDRRIQVNDETVVILVWVAYEDSIWLQGAEINRLGFLAKGAPEVQQDCCSVLRELNACSADLLCALMNNQLQCRLPSRFLIKTMRIQSFLTLCCPAFFLSLSSYATC